MLHDYFAKDDFCAGSNFGKQCISLLKQMKAQKDMIDALQYAIDKQLVLGRELAACHPDQEVNIENFATLPFHLPDGPNENDVSLRYPLARPFSGPIVDFDGDDGNISWFIDPEMFERLVDCIEQWIRWDTDRKPFGKLDVESKLQDDEPEFSVGDLKSICGLGNDTVKKYGKKALGWWIGRGKSGKQFTMRDAFKIISAIHANTPEQSTKAKCDSWLASISEVNP